jgi:hypothetical protein
MYYNPIIMFYLERNRAVVVELRELWRPQRGQSVGSSSAKMSFFSVGSYNSQVLGKEVFVGLKEYRNPNRDNSLLQFRAPEVATITAIAEHRPHLREDLPLFYALLRGAKGKPVGLLMEDFSAGGRRAVHGSSWVPAEVVELFGRDVLEEDFICNMSFNVGDGQYRLGDFYPFFKTFMKQHALARAPMSQAIRQVRRNFGQHTVRLGIDLPAVGKTYE